MSAPIETVPLERTSGASLRTAVLRRRFLRKHPDSRVHETVRGMFTRVANAVAGVEARYGASRCEIEAVAAAFLRLMVKGRFLPNSPTLMNAGHDRGMCSACFVLPIEDSIEGIDSAALCN